MAAHDQLNRTRFHVGREHADKVTVLSETAHLWERRGGDLDRARRALAVAFKLDPDDAQVRAEYERLAGATRAWDQLAETYEEALAETPDLISKRDILAVLANVHDEKRDDPRRALGAYDRLREVDETELGRSTRWSTGDGCSATGRSGARATTRRARGGRR